MRRILNNLLVVDLFLVVGGFVWFIFGVTLAFMGLPQGYNLWVKLWYPLFQPALGILMFGALTTGVWGWLARRRQM